jgi:hypothetical protein
VLVLEGVAERVRVRGGLLGAFEQEVEQRRKKRAPNSKWSTMKRSTTAGTAMVSKKPVCEMYRS